MDTLYVLCRSVDNNHPRPLAAADVATIVAHKQAHFHHEAQTNPLLGEILAGGNIASGGPGIRDRHGFLRGLATFFRAHELLRKTRAANAPFVIGERQFSHDEVADMFARCIPNANLCHIPWFSLASYRMSLALAWVITLLTAHLMAQEEGRGLPFDPAVLYYLGIASTVVALVGTSLTQNRDVRHAAPWNSALYLDLNADLLRRGSPTLAVARKEILPRQSLFKTPRFYYALARRIESHDFDAELARLLPDESRRAA